WRRGARCSLGIENACGSFDWGATTAAPHQGSFALMQLRTRPIPILALSSVMALLVGEGTALGHNLIEISATAGYRFGGRAKVQLDRLGDSNPPVGKFVLEGSP